MTSSMISGTDQGAPTDQRCDTDSDDDLDADAQAHVEGRKTPRIIRAEALDDLAALDGKYL